MKLTTLLLIIALVQASAAGFSQVRISAKNTSLESVFNTIKKQTGYTFFYNLKDIRNMKVSVQLDDVSLTQALDQCFKDLPLAYNIEDKTIFVSKKATVQLSPQADVINIDVRGRVVDENGKPLPGATVTVNDGSNRTGTDRDGYFILRGLDEQASITITFIGYQSMTLKAKPDLGTIALQLANTALHEVVVSKGYYTEKKALSTSNVSSISAKDIQSQPVNNPLLALQGRVPSLQITQNNGMPGSGITVRVQGINSLDCGNEPYYVVDGVPISNQLPTNLGDILGNSGGQGTGTTRTSGNPLAYLNPSDIESIDVLKDADATAIYGSLAANGAILITTKKGKAGQSRVDFTLQSGWGTVAHFLDMMNTQEYLAMRREAHVNSGLTVPSFQSNPVYNVNATTANYDLTVWDQNRYTDWQKELIGGTAGYQDAQVAISGGNASTTFRVNGGYHRETSVFPGDASDNKASVGFNINHVSPNQKFRMQFSGNYMLDQNKLLGEDLTNRALRLAPNAPAIFNSDGTLNWAQIPTATGGFISTWTNPLAQALYGRSTLRVNNLMSNALAGYEIIPGLNIKATFGFSNVSTNDKRLRSLMVSLPEDRPTGTRSSTFVTGNIQNWIVEPQISYSKNISKGVLEALIGSTFQGFVNESITAIGMGYSSDQLMENLSSAPTFQSSNTYEKYRYNALFGRFSYNWDEKYAINLTARRDGTSRFGDANRLHNFWSLGGAWVFSNEDFAKNIAFLSFGKLRANYGTTGNQQIGSYQYISNYSAVSVGTAYQGVAGLLPTNLANPYLEWELTRKISLGTELGFLKDRINITADFFRNRSSNQLVQYLFSVQTGFNGVYMNLPATLQNQGWEFTLSTQNVKSKEWSWRTSFNVSILRNKLAQFDNIATTSYATTRYVGYPINISRRFSYGGVNPATGAPLFYKADGSTTSTPNSTIDNFYIYDPNPKWSGGLVSSLSWKQFSLDIAFQYIKKDIVSLYSDFNAPGFFNGTSNFANIPAIFDDRWRNPGDNALLQKFVTSSFYNSNAVSSSLGYTDGAFLRVKNVAFSYQLPAKLQQKLSMKNARLFANGENLYTFTKYKGLDPETGALSLPPLRVITLGIQASF